MSKRFEVQKDDFVHRRIEAVRQSFGQLKKANPEVVSFVMFGSMTKGTAKEQSDIDGYIFVDSDDIQEKMDQDPLVEELDRYGDDLTREVNFKEGIARKYSEEMRSLIAQRVSGLRKEQIAHIRSLPINRGIIDKDLDGMSDSIKAHILYKENSQAIERHLSERWYQ